MKFHTSILAAAMLLLAQNVSLAQSTTGNVGLKSATEASPGAPGYDTPGACIECADQKPLVNGKSFDNLLPDDTTVKPAPGSNQQGVRN